jgi:hypothetical protein
MQSYAMRTTLWHKEKARSRLGHRDREPTQVFPDPHEALAEGKTARLLRPTK